MISTVKNLNLKKGMNDDRDRVNAGIEIDPFPLPVKIGPLRLVVCT
jgi:hypothetical protein